MSVWKGGTSRKKLIGEEVRTKKKEEKEKGKSTAKKQAQKNKRKWFKV